jgi:hypothetical protein
MIELILLQRVALGAFGRLRRPSFQIRPDLRARHLHE